MLICWYVPFTSTTENNFLVTALHSFNRNFQNRITHDDFYTIPFTSNDCLSEPYGHLDYFSAKTKSGSKQYNGELFPHSLILGYFFANNSERVSMYTYEGDTPHCLSQHSFIFEKCPVVFS